jgi:hypothetical protein
MSGTEHWIAGWLGDKEGRAGLRSVESATSNGILEIDSRFLLPKYVRVSRTVLAVTSRDKSRI